MPIRHRLPILLTLLLPMLTLSSCAVTGPADDGWENSHEWVDNGRLLSDETRTIYRSSDAHQAGAAQDAGLDYDAYQQWQQAREKNSAEYRKFKLWQEFEAFERWKLEQGSQ